MSATKTCPHCHRRMVRTSDTRHAYECRNPKCPGPKDKGKRAKALWER